MPPEDFADVLRRAGFSEALWSVIGDEELPLPPDERNGGCDVAALSRRFDLQDDTPWVGPHIARTVRFLDLVDAFIALLNASNLPTFNLNLGRLHPRYRLFEVFSSTMIEPEAAEHWAKEFAPDTPHLLIDLKGYLRVGLEASERAYERSGGQDPMVVRTLMQPISLVEFQVYADGDGHPLIKRQCEVAAQSLDLKCEWKGATVEISLPDTHLYRDHRYSV